MLILNYRKWILDKLEYYLSNSWRHYYNYNNDRLDALYIGKLGYIKHIIETNSKYNLSKYDK